MRGNACQGTRARGQEPGTPPLVASRARVPGDKNAGDRRVNNKDIDTTGLINQLIKAIMEIFK